MVGDERDHSVFDVSVVHPGTSGVSPRRYHLLFSGPLHFPCSLQEGAGHHGFQFHVSIMMGRKTGRVFIITIFYFFVTL